MASIRKRIWTSGGTEKTAWICDYRDQEGNRVLKTFATKRGADAFKTEMGYEVSQGTHTPPAPPLPWARPVKSG